MYKCNKCGWHGKKKDGIDKGGFDKLICPKCTDQFIVPVNSEVLPHITQRTYAKWFSDCNDNALNIENAQHIGPIIISENSPIKWFNVKVMGESYNYKFKSEDIEKLIDIREQMFQGRLYKYEGAK